MITLPSRPTPRVSVIVVTARQPLLLARCLDALARCGAEVPFETVVVLNAAVAETKALTRDGVRGATVVESNVPLGLAGGANRGRAAARGELLVLLHDDAEVEPGWLEGLVAAADAHPEAAVVGSIVLNPDGSPQSAGSLLWSDATVWTLGAAHSMLPVSDEVAAVDYCGTSSMLVRAETWDAVGGAEERLYPAYYVDVDLCLKAWRRGAAVLRAQSRIRHHQSASTEPAFREFLLRRNRTLMLEIWSEQLALHEPPGHGNRPAVERAYARAQERWARARDASAGAAPTPTPAPPFDPAAQERRLLQIAHDLQRDWEAELRQQPRQS